jgi:hypothetical protein
MQVVVVGGQVGTLLNEYRQFSRKLAAMLKAVKHSSSQMKVRWRGWATLLVHFRGRCREGGVQAADAHWRALTHTYPTHTCTPLTPAVLRPSAARCTAARRCVVWCCTQAAELQMSNDAATAQRQRESLMGRAFSQEREALANQVSELQEQLAAWDAEVTRMTAARQESDAVVDDLRVKLSQVCGGAQVLRAVWTGGGGV